MNINRIGNNNQQTFGIGYSKALKATADRFYCQNKNPDQKAFNAVFLKLKYMEQHYPYDNYFLELNYTKKGDKIMPAIYATRKDESASILLFCKDNLFKLFEKLKHMNEYELTIKMNKGIMENCKD